MSHSFLIVDDERDFLESVKRGLRIAGYRNLTLLADPIEAARLVEGGERFDVALLDITMAGMDGLALLDRIKTVCPDTECIMVTAIDEVGTAVECMRKGASDYLVKPFAQEELLVRIQRVLERKRLLEIVEARQATTPPALRNPEAFRDIRTQSPLMQRVLKEAELHAASDLPVLITGESGTGKELLARAIHRASSRAGHPFLAVNMASLSETLFEAEFFGHTKGAFTGADQKRFGYLECAHKGTLFLDEIGTLPAGLQGKLLRVLQEGEVLRIGSSKPVVVDIRFIAATNQDLERLMARQQFRRDLFYRLRGAWLRLPPLRERREDIPLLVDRFIGDMEPARRPRSVEPNVLRILSEYDYPGNVRELRSIVESAANLAQGRVLSVSCLPDDIKPKPARRELSPETSTSVSGSLADVERVCILSAYESTGRNKAQTARRLGIGLSTLRRKLESFGID